MMVLASRLLEFEGVFMGLIRLLQALLVSAIL